MANFRKQNESQIQERGVIHAGLPTGVPMDKPFANLQLVLDNARQKMTMVKSLYQSLKIKFPREENYHGQALYRE